MRIRIALFAALIIGLMLAAAPAMAQPPQDIYDNGPTNGNTSSWALDGYPTVPVVSDSFTVTLNGTMIDGFNFAAWVGATGNSPTSAELSITSQENGGTVYLDQVFNFYMQNCVLNNDGYYVCTFSTGFAGPILNAGTYWVNLTDGETQRGWTLYWDENSGPSSASQDQVGTIPSESFTVFGQGGTSTTQPTVPEPSTALLLGSGLLALGGLLRCRLS